MPNVTGLSGHDFYCLRQKGLIPGEQVIGNCIHPAGFLGGSGSSKGALGTEAETVTEVIQEARQIAYDRLVQDAEQRGGVGIVAVTSRCNRFEGNFEFMSTGSCVHQENSSGGQLQFSASANGAAWLCHMDAGFTPMRFVFGNVVYGMASAGSIMNHLKGFKRGEVKEFSDALNLTRHLALKRIVGEARAVGANAVLGIETSLLPFPGPGFEEMLMVGTACRNPRLPAECTNAPATSDMTGVETWNMVNLGYVPVKLVLASTVYSLGAGSGIKAALQSLKRGELEDLTIMVYEARQQVLGLVADEARAVGADDVVGVTHHVYEMGNLVEFLAVGTAVRRVTGTHTTSTSLPGQVMVKDKDTWVRMDEMLDTASSATS